MMIALGGTDAAVSNALAGVLHSETPRLKIIMDDDFKPDPLRLRANSDSIKV